MKIQIEQIRVTDRIRKQAVKIKELAVDIDKNGLINPITVMPSGGEYQLLAGLRRLKAAQSLSWTEIEVNAVAPADAEAALRIEYSENEQREPFTFSEKMDYARLIEEIEQAKALERMSDGGSKAGRGRPKQYEQGTDHGPYPIGGETRNIIGEKIGMSGRQYGRAKFIADNAPPDVIDALDRGDCTIRRTYDAMRVAEKQPKDSAASNLPAASKVSTQKAPAPESDLDRAIRAEQELDAMKYRWHNEIYHRDGIIENLKIRITGLEEELTAANIRIHELEAQYETANAS